ncbi:UPF0481 protein At3g47200-like [Vigna unguiculata]|uniref:Uncharacterized protein n=1 Tax=Vigna unguiculata TaxID=3917 RepID=A0A4D6NWI4_VIGUN|nr:UPF0481 protein At3g47200-like [Vigna unguiculata]QCE16227.1 hypothetical protein DEO72_LG11g3240 [Vigna unguiculata]
MTNHRDHKNFVIDIRKKLEEAGPPITKECSIYRVPFDIRKHNEDAYTPKIVSIGPLHHNNHHRLQNMERHKLVYCNAFLERTQTSLDTWIRYIEEIEPDFRRCYSETLGFSKEELVNIIVVDSGFIFELFWKDRYNEWSGNDTFLLIPLIRDTIAVDLLLFENQIPFHVLTHLFNLSLTSVAGNNAIPSFIELTFLYFEFYNTPELKFDDNNISISHFTDLIRTFHLQHPPERRPPRTTKLLKHVPTANELSEAGVHFKVLDSVCLLDLKFSGGVLRMPQLKVEDRTEVLFRNMVALEQCHYPHESYITDYVSLLDFLINTSRDVDTLVQQEVLVNWTGDTDSVVNLFNSLGKNITQSNMNLNYWSVSHGLNGFYHNIFNKLKSTLRRDYCDSPWQTAATIAAIVLLVLSVIQTVCSIMSVIPQE